jgi:hypothetical protein
MIIQLTPEIAYDTELVFEAQSDECKAFVADYKTKVQGVAIWDDSNRPTRTIWANITWQIVDTIQWLTNYDWSVGGTITTVEEIGEKYNG